MFVILVGSLGVFLIVLMASFWQRPILAPMLAAPSHYLDDQAGLVSPAFAAAKSQYIEHLSRTMKIAQLNIVILPRVPGGSVDDFTIRAATAWKLGAAGVDNGLVLFVFRDERVLRLEVGYGLEAVLPDVVANRLLSEQIVPAFSQGHYEAGIEDFLAALNQTLEASKAAANRAAPSAAMLAFVWNVIRNAPRMAAQTLGILRAADPRTRIIAALSAGLVMALLARALIAAITGILAGVVALLQLPSRLMASPTLSSLDRAVFREQFAIKNCFIRPPPVMVSLVQELHLSDILNALYILIGLAAAIALVFVNSSILIGGLGHFGGAGVTLGWAASLP